MYNMSSKAVPAFVRGDNNTNCIVRFSPISQMLHCGNVSELLGMSLPLHFSGWFALEMRVETLLDTWVSLT